MKSVLTIADSTIRGVNYRLIYDPEYQVWSIYRYDLEVWNNDDGMASYEVYSAMLRQELEHGS
jgi:hypothetical protein